MSYGEGEREGRLGCTWGERARWIEWEDSKEDARSMLGRTGMDSVAAMAGTAGAERRLRLDLELRRVCQSTRLQRRKIDAECENSSCGA